MDNCGAKETGKIMEADAIVIKSRGHLSYVGIPQKVKRDPTLNEEKSSEELEERSRENFSWSSGR